MKHECVFYILLTFAVIFLFLSVICYLPFFPEWCSNFVSICIGICSNLSMFVSAFAYHRSEKCSEELDKALKIKRDRTGEVKELTIDCGEF